MEKLYNAVIYTDGSAIMDANYKPSFFGAGCHGYFYTDDKLKTKSGNKPSKFTIADIGYIEQAQLLKYKHETVVPDFYYDAYYSYTQPGTSNVGEILGILETLKIFLSLEDIKFKSIRIKADSEYALGIVHHILNDPERKWYKEDRVNINYWLEMEEVINSCLKQGIEIYLDKVKGHSDNVGNDIADRLAYLGRLQSSRGIGKIDYHITPEKQYWKPNEERHIFLRYKQLFFLNNLRATDIVPTYSIIDYKTDMEPGRKTADALFGMAVFKERQETIENVISVYQSYLKQFSIISTVELNNLFSQYVLHYYKLFGNAIFDFDYKKETLFALEDVPVVHAIRPAGLATKAMERTIGLYDIIRDYEDMLSGKQPKRYFIDITDEIFGKDGKGKPKTLLEPSQKYLKLTREVDGRNILFPIELGKDSIDRNQFKKIEKLEPKVYLVVMQMTETYMEYFVLIDLVKEGNKAVFCNFYSNRVYLPPKK